MNLSSAVRATKSLITANSPVLLVGTAVAGVVATGILAAKGGYKARGIVDEAQAKQTEPLTVQDKAKLTWLCYAAPAVTGVSTIASVAGVHLIHNKRHAALAGLYAMATTKLDDVTEKAEELLGAKKSQQLRDEVSQKAVDRSPLNDHELIVTETGTEIVMDEISGRYYTGSLPIVENAVNLANITLVENGEVNLNEIYDHVGLTPSPIGEQLGWSRSAGRISAKFGAANTPDGKACITVRFRPEPTVGYDKV